ncbi:hypothetical protein L1049_004611 [Liquidambar formosana]|uniref:Uncharacterized protein n=1 Tax=Liquidambar formosana TaxID=63359 RepID=A0AAP0WWB8_LIQFO
MANFSNLLLISSLFVTALIFSSPAANASGGDLHQFNWVPTTTAATSCQGSLAECLAGEELDMDSEINRRILATSQYIGYGALQRNTVPCSQRGASYYNCQPGAQANPYSRSCSSLSRCR